MEKAELETTITYDMAERVVRIFSAIRRDQGKLRRAGITPKYGTADRGYGYEVPIMRLKWRITSGVKRPARVGGFKPRNTAIQRQSTDGKT